MLRKRFIVIFYFLVGYIFISFTWWVLLLIKVNNEAFAEKQDLMELNFIYQDDPAKKMEQLAQMQKLEEERKRKLMMITGEGSVFLVILVLMTVMMQRSLSREIKVMRQQKNFLLSITHEFRSPIASAKVAMQTLAKRRDLPQEKYETLVANSLSDMERLQVLVENILLAAKIEDHSFRIGQDACDLSEIVGHVIQKLKETAGVDRKFELSVQPDVLVVGDRMGLTSVIMNLIENAVKYSTDGSVIHISLKNEDDKVVFRIADNGLGIPDAEKKKIFDKFYRVGQEETRKTKGTGLGLYIVQKILSLHRGSVQVRDNKPRGSVFEVVLPKAI